MSFLRHGEIYRFDGHRRQQQRPGRKRGSQATAPAHRCDEFPAGYSLAGCAPAEPASASSAAVRLNGPLQRDNTLAANGDLSRICVSQAWGPDQAWVF